MLYINFYILIYTEMKYLKLYEQFMLLEAIENLDKIKFAGNEFAKEIAGKTKEYLETIFPNQNLKYLGAGGVGLAFEWLDSNELPDSFYEVDFFGEKCDNKSKCIKVTMSNTEAEQIKKRLGKKDKGLCHYYWIKESEWQNKKIYLICMDLLQMPTIQQKMVIHLIFIISFTEFGNTNYLNNNVDYKLTNLFNWLKSGNPEYSEEEFDKNLKSKIKMQNQIGMKLDTLVGMFCIRNKIKNQEDKIKGYWRNMDQEFFITLSKEILNIYNIAKRQNLNIDDIHENNMGYRSGELVAYDFI